FEVMAGTLVATLAVLGLAYSFGIGRGLIDRYAVARQAMGRAELVVDSLVTVAPPSLASGSQPFWVDRSFLASPVQAGATTWTITNVDDPIDRLAGSTPPDTRPIDMKRIVVMV